MNDHSETGQFTEGNQASLKHGMSNVQLQGVQSGALAHPDTFRAVMNDLSDQVGVMAAIQANAAAAHTSVIALQNFIAEEITAGTNLVDLGFAFTLLLRSITVSDRTLRTWEKHLPDDGITESYKQELERIKDAVDAAA